MATQAQIKAASDALGYDLDAEQVSDQLAAYADLPTYHLRQRLKAAERRFADAGGRGVALAEAIDGLRIVLAAREA